MAAKFFTGLPLDGPDPECVRGHGEQALSAAARHRDGAPAVGRPLAPDPSAADTPSPPRAALVAGPPSGGGPPDPGVRPRAGRWPAFSPQRPLNVRPADVSPAFKLTGPVTPGGAGPRPSAG